MTNRVALGSRSGVMGLWVSRPGVDVLAASEDDMLLSTSVPSLQVIASGVIGDPGAGGTATIGFPDMGFQPFIIFGCEAYDLRLEYLSNVSARFNAYSRGSALPLGPSLSGEIRYSVTNIPV